MTVGTDEQGRDVTVSWRVVATFFALSAAHLAAIAYFAGVGANKISHLESRMMEMTKDRYTGSQAAHERQMSQKLVEQMFTSSEIKYGDLHRRITELEHRPRN